MRSKLCISNRVLYYILLGRKSNHSFAESVFHWLLEWQERARADYNRLVTKQQAWIVANPIDTLDPAALFPLMPQLMCDTMALDDSWVLAKLPIAHADIDRIALCSMRTEFYQQVWI